MLFSYKLLFRSPLHIGERGVGLEVARTYVPADTLFSALCMAWRELYGAESLCSDVLEQFSRGDVSDAPFFLTSAFPFAASVRFYPRPFGRLPGLEIPPGQEKAFKRTRYVTESVFSKLTQGEPCTFEENHCINGQQAWASEQEKQQLEETWTDDETGEIVLWKTAVVPRVTLDRITSASEIWHFGETLYAQGAGLWFAIEFKDQVEGQFRQKLDASLRLLGDQGLGGERGAGRGLFEVQGPVAESVTNVWASGRFVTLSPVCPATAQQAAALTGEGAAYELMCRRGWICSPEGSHLRRKSVWMFAEGSILTGGNGVRPGRLADVTPNALKAHSVYRYGYAFPVGVKD